MSSDDIEGDWILGWPDRKPPRPEYYKDAEGRVVFARSPFLDLQGPITPTEAHYIVAQLQMPDPVHPADYTFSIHGSVERATIERCRLDICCLAPGSFGCDG